MSTPQEFHDPELQRAFSRARGTVQAKKKRLLPWIAGGSIALVGGTLALCLSPKPVDPVRQIFSSYQALQQQSPEKAGGAAYDIVSAALADNNAASIISERIVQANRERPEEFRLLERIRYAMLAAQGGVQEHQALAPANIAYVMVKDMSGAELSVQRLDGAAYTVATVSAYGAAPGIHGLVVQKISPTASTAGTMPTPPLFPSGVYAPSHQLQPLQPPLLEQRPNTSPLNPTGAVSPSGYQHEQHSGQPHGQHILYQPPTLERLTSGSIAGGTPYRLATHRVQNR